MGPKHNSGLPDRLLLDSTSTCNTSRSTILCIAESFDFRGGNRITTEGCNRGSSTGRANRVSFKLYSNLFLVPKKDGGQCPVINLKVLNNFVSKKHFKMEGIHTLKDLLKRGDWLAKIMPSFQYPSTPTTKISQVHVPREDLPIQLPTLQPILNLMGVQKNSKTSTSNPLRSTLIAYIDNLLLLAESKDLILDQVTGVRYLLECLGFIVNIKKSILDPAQVIEFLGLSVDSLAMEIRLPPVKIKQKLTSWQKQ